MNNSVVYVGTKINLQEDVSTVTVQVSTDYGIAGIVQRQYTRFPFWKRQFDSAYPLKNIMGVWLNGYNAGLSRLVVRVRIPLSPQAKNETLKWVI